MTPELQSDLLRIRRDCERALALSEESTAGPWGTQTYSFRVQTNYGGIGHVVADMMSETSYERDTDAAFIVFARTFSPAAARAVLTLLDVLEKQAAVILHKQVAEFAVSTLQALAEQWPKEQR